MQPEHYVSANQGISNNQNSKRSSHSQRKGCSIYIKGALAVITQSLAHGQPGN